MANTIIALFVEGPTEIEFYKAVVKFAHDAMETPFDCSFEWLDMHGIGNYKNTAARKFRNLKKKNPYSDIYAILCIDTDAFELSKKPPIDKDKVKQALKEEGAKQVFYIEAKSSIEDWFLEDLAGVCSYLKLSPKTKRPPGRGQEALKTLFKSANRVYLKGNKTEGFIAKLDMPQIMSARCKELNPLCSLVGFDCIKICHKSTKR